MLSLALALMLAAHGQGNDERSLRPRITRDSERTRGASDSPIFKFLTDTITSDQECTGAALTSSRGTVTHTRTSAGTCTKRNGVLVTMVANDERLEQHGILSEQPGTNGVIRNDELENVAWTGTNVAAIVANTDPDPFGTTTAEYVCTTSAGGYIESTAFVLGIAGGAASVYAKAQSGTQAGAVVLRDTTAGVDRCTSSFTADDTWLDNRQGCAHLTGVSATNNHVVRVYPGGLAGSGCLVLYGVQGEGSPSSNAPMMSSLILTDGVAVTRSGDSYSVTGVNSAQLTKSTYFKFVVRQQLVSLGAMGYLFYTPDGVSTNPALLGTTGNVFQCWFINGSADPVVTSTATFTRGADNTVSCEYGASSLTACIGGACNSSAVTWNVSPVGKTYGTFFVGRGSSVSNALKGHIRNVCISNVKTHCP